MKFKNQVLVYIVHQGIFHFFRPSKTSSTEKAATTSAWATGSDIITVKNNNQWSYKLDNKPQVFKAFFMTRFVQLTLRTKSNVTSTSGPQFEDLHAVFPSVTAIMVIVVSFIWCRSRQAAIQKFWLRRWPVAQDFVIKVCNRAMPGV